VVIPRLENDFVEILKATAEKKLNQITIRTNPLRATTLMLVAGGYPEAYEKGLEISGLENLKDVFAFHAGTKIADGKVVTNGGRVIALTALGNTIEEALAKSNEAAKNVTWQGRYYRTDIGKDLLQYQIQ